MPNIGGKSHETNTGTKFFQIKEPKGESWTDEYYKATVDTCFTQMGKKGINIYGKRAVLAMLNEYKKLHNIYVFGTQDTNIMSHQEKYRSLRDVNLIKEKRCGKIKERTCADRSCQRTYIPREEATFTTIPL